LLGTGHPLALAGTAGFHDAFAVVGALSVATIVAATLIGRSSPAVSLQHRLPPWPPARASGAL
jgi:hypothetical protein